MCSGGSAVCDEELGDVRLSVLCCQEQRCPFVIVVVIVHIGAVVDEELGDVHAPTLCGGMQRRGAPFGVDVGFLQKLFNRSSITGPSMPKEGFLGNLNRTFLSRRHLLFLQRSLRFLLL